MDEIKTLMKAYQTELGETPQLLSVALSARKNICIHPEVRPVLGGREEEGGERGGRGGGGGKGRGGGGGGRGEGRGGGTGGREVRRGEDRRGGTGSLRICTFGYESECTLTWV